MKIRFSAHPKLVKYIKISLTALGLVALMAAVAFAEEHGGAEEGATTMEWVWRVLNFGIILGVLIYFVAKPFKNFLAKRTADIESSLVEAKKTREEALSRLAAVEAKLKDKETEIKGILAVAQSNGEKERDILAKEAEQMAADVLASAKELIEAELVKAKEAIRREAALKAVELAEKMIRENVKKEDQARMLGEYLEKVGK